MAEEGGHSEEKDPGSSSMTCGHRARTYYNHDFLASCMHVACIKERMTCGQSARGLFVPLVPCLHLVGTKLQSATLPKFLGPGRLAGKWLGD